MAIFIEYNKSIKYNKFTVIQIQNTQPGIHFKEHFIFIQSSTNRFHESSLFY